jgi:hypothetical protein
MAKKSAVLPVVRIHDASLGSEGRVIKGAEITEIQAVSARRAGQHVVVCGPDKMINAGVAQRIEGRVGPYQRGAPHVRTAGRFALPHFQQVNPPPDGHTFYETEHRKAAKNP